MCLFYFFVLRTTRNLSSKIPKEREKKRKVDLIKDHNHHDMNDDVHAVVYMGYLFCALMRTDNCQSRLAALFGI
jgi:hypothetical protein